MRYSRGQVVTTMNGARFVPVPYADQCHRCGKRPAMDLEGFFYKWLPANQHALDTKTRAVIEATFPFEFRCYESWGVALYLRFVMPPPPEHLETATDALAGQRFGPFQCMCEADALVEKWFEARTGSKWQPGSSAYGAMRDFIEAPVPLPEQPGPKLVPRTP